MLLFYPLVCSYFKQAAKANNNDLFSIGKQNIVWLLLQAMANLNFRENHIENVYCWLYCSVTDVFVTRQHLVGFAGQRNLCASNAGAAARNVSCFPLGQFLFDLCICYQSFSGTA